MIIKNQCRTREETKYLILCRMSLRLLMNTQFPTGCQAVSEMCTSVFPVEVPNPAPEFFAMRVFESMGLQCIGAVKAGGTAGKLSGRGKRRGAGGDPAGGRRRRPPKDVHLPSCAAARCAGGWPRATRAGRGIFSALTFRCDRLGPSGRVGLSPSASPAVPSPRLFTFGPAARLWVPLALLAAAQV